MANCNTKYDNDKQKPLMEHFGVGVGGIVGIIVGIAFILVLVLWISRY